jgi:hypothetical protein
MAVGLPALRTGRSLLPKNIIFLFLVLHVQDLVGCSSAMKMAQEATIVLSSMI